MALAMITTFPQTPSSSSSYYFTKKPRDDRLTAASRFLIKKKKGDDPNRISSSSSSSQSCLLHGHHSSNSLSSSLSSSSSSSSQQQKQRQPPPLPVLLLSKIHNNITTTGNGESTIVGCEPKGGRREDDADHCRSLWSTGGAGWLCCSCVDSEELKEAAEYQAKENDPYYAYMLGNGDKNAKTQAYVGKGRNPFWKQACHNSKRFRTKKTRSAAGRWFLELVCGPFMCKETAVIFKKAWSKSRGVDSKRDRALLLAQEYHIAVYDFRLPCGENCVRTDNNQVACPSPPSVPFSIAC